MFHRVKDVKPLLNFRLSLEFISGERKEYEITPLFDRWKRI